MPRLVIAASFALAIAIAPMAAAQCPGPPTNYPQPGFYTRIDVSAQLMLGWDLELRRVATLDVGSGPPVLLGTWPADGIEDVAVDGALGAIVDGGALRLLDLADPAAPAEIGSFATSGFFVDVDLDSGLAAVHDLELAEVTLIDATVATAPRAVGRYPVSQLRDLALWQGILYLAFDQGLALVDVSQPATPVLLVERDDLSAFAAVSAGGGYLVAHDLEFAAISVYDIASPPDVSPLGSHPAGDPRDVAVFPCRAWVAQQAIGRSGLEALALDDCADCAARCIEDGRTLCLADRRFQVRATWSTADGDAGEAGARGLTADTGYFWFFHPDNVEVIVKVLDACPVFGHHWAFLAGLTNVQVEVHVEDLLAEQSRSYVNPLGRPFPPILDTAAFATCP